MLQNDHIDRPGVELRVLTGLAMGVIIDPGLKDISLIDTQNP